MRPVVDGLKGEYADKVEFREVDFYENRDMARKYNAPGHPTLVITKPDGTAVSVLPGVPSRETIVEALKKVTQ